MKVLKLALAITFLMSFFSCSRQFKIARIQPGQTYTDQAVKLLDEPDVAERSAINPNFQVYIWQDVSLQINNEEIVTAIHRKPNKHEKTLQFWKQHYQDQETNFRRISSLERSEQLLWQFDIPKEGMSAIYDETIDEVTKVILYEKKQ
jgi:nicotinamidase-related amidase